MGNTVDPLLSKSRPTSSEKHHLYLTDSTSRLWIYHNLTVPPRVRKGAPVRNGDSRVGSAFSQHPRFSLTGLNEDTARALSLGDTCRKAFLTVRIWRLAPPPPTDLAATVPRNGTLRFTSITSKRILFDTFRPESALRKKIFFLLLLCRSPPYVVMWQALRSLR